MEMHEIRYFIAACQTLNFHRAAEIVHVSQPALTRAIQKLEAELGGYLFRREKAHVQLTEFGNLMRTHLGDVLERTETAKKNAQNFLSLDTKSLTIGVMCTIGPLRFVGFLNQFRERHPGITINVIDGAAGKLVELLKGGTLDIAVLARPEPFDAGLQAEEIYSERFGLAFSAGHRFGTCPTIQFSEVRGEPYLDRINCEYSKYIEEVGKSLGFEITSAYRSEREDWILAMVAAGMGVCCIAEFSVGQPGVAFRPFIDPIIARNISLVTNTDHPQSIALTRFAKSAKEYDWLASHSPLAQGPPL